MLTVLERSKPETFVLFLDNCRVHHSKKVSQLLLENRIDVIYNVTYGPQYNPIERVWSQIKLLFKKEKMGHILFGRARPQLREDHPTHPVRIPSREDLQHLQGDHEKPDGSMILRCFI